MIAGKLLLVTAGLLLLCVKIPVSASPLTRSLFGSERAAEAVPTQPATTETPTPTPAAPARDKYFGPDDIIASEVYACPEGQFITSIALYAEDLVGGMAFMKCAATGAKPQRQELKIGTRNPARGGRRVDFASATGFDGAAAGAVYDDALCPGCSYDGRFVAGLALRRAAGDARDWTYTAGSHNGKFPLKPFYCPPGTKIVALRVASRYDRLAPSPFISGFGVVCGEPAAA
eukprot:TRINITY_DN16190_c0_g1_i1.p1 TRINITY_DN16190_c0_g1~~TRINITY_DN16190_c0_g1_i1.p1  ORF type:complete len:231 (-),score=85.15 TRINITY_DN16190_c0_g1_i1:67-759(-)